MHPEIKLFLVRNKLETVQHSLKLEIERLQERIGVSAYALTELLKQVTTVLKETE